MEETLSRSEIMKQLWKRPDFIQKMQRRRHKPKIGDGLNRWQRYRLKDVEAYRKLKREFARTPEERRKRLEYMRGWRAKNRARHNELARLSHHKHKHKHVLRNRDYALRRKFGIGLEEKLFMVQQQEGKCKICGNEFTSSRAPQVDHDHSTGKIRGILCTSCNTKLEWYLKNHEAIRGYLK